MDIVSCEQAYLFVADEPRIQKPVVLKRKIQKGEGQAVLIGTPRMLTTRQMWRRNTKNEEYHQRRPWSGVKKSRISWRCQLPHAEMAACFRLICTDMCPITESLEVSGSVSLVWSSTQIETLPGVKDIHWFVGVALAVTNTVPLCCTDLWHM